MHKHVHRERYGRRSDLYERGASLMVILVSLGDLYSSHIHVVVHRGYSIRIFPEALSFPCNQSSYLR